MFNFLPHPFSLHPDHRVYFAAFFLLVIAFSLISTVLRVVLPKAPYSLLIVLLWSLLIIFCSHGDFYELTPQQLIPLLLLGGFCFFALVKKTMPRDSGSFLSLYLEKNSAKELICTIALYLVGLFLLSVPLLFGFPVGTLVTGHFVANDSVTHSIMANGSAYMHYRQLDPYFFYSGLRGTQSFTYYFHTFFRDIPTSRIILPTVIASYSLTVLSADILLRALNISNVWRFFCALLPVCAFLPVSAVYTIFLGQVSAVAPTFAALAVVFSSEKFGTFLQKLLFVSIFTLGAIAIYGLFPLSIIVFGVGVWIVLEITRASFSLSDLKNQIKNNISLSPVSITIALGVLVLTVPSVRFAVYMLSIQGTRTGGSDHLSSFGNLPEGYLSPLHLSGVWPASLGYRDVLVRNWSALGNALLFLILLQFFLALQVSAGGIGFLLTLAIPTFAATILIKSPYVHSKYFSYLVIGFLLVAGAGLQTARNNLAKVFPSALNKIIKGLFFCCLLGFETLCVLWPLPTNAVIPSLNETNFVSFENTWKLLENKRALVLTKEDWLQFDARPDDFLPLTQYFPRPYKNESIDSLVIDRAYRNEAMEYLKQYPGLLLLVEEQRCLQLVGDRFEIYFPKC